MEILNAMLAGQSCGKRSVIDACNDWSEGTWPLAMPFGAVMALAAVALLLLSAA